MLEIAEQDVIEGLKQDNPWWERGEGSISFGLPKSRAYLGRFMELSLNWRIKRAIILMGPRRVGKTVMLHQLIERALASGVNPQSILFASVDTPLYSGMPPDRLLALFERQTAHDPRGRRIVIFDEIQYLKDWEVHLKALTDRHPNTRFIVSGSAAAALRSCSSCS